MQETEIKPEFDDQLISPTAAGTDSQIINNDDLHPGENDDLRGRDVETAPRIVNKLDFNGAPDDDDKLPPPAAGSDSHYDEDELAALGALARADAGYFYTDEYSDDPDHDCYFSDSDDDEVFMAKIQEIRKKVGIETPNSVVQTEDMAVGGVAVDGVSLSVQKKPSVGGEDSVKH